MPNENAKANAIVFARSQIAEIDAQIARLTRERIAVANFLWALSGEGEYHELPAPAVVQPRAAQRAPDERVYHSRQFNKAVVDEALRMIDEASRPMSAPEIYERHPKRDLISPEGLYRLLYNRVVSGKIMSINGAFWPEDIPVPRDVDISTGVKRGPNTNTPIQVGDYDSPPSPTGP